MLLGVTNSRNSQISCVLQSSSKMVHFTQVVCFGQSTSFHYKSSFRRSQAAVTTGVHWFYTWSGIPQLADPPRPKSALFFYMLAFPTVSGSVTGIGAGPPGCGLVGCHLGIAAADLGRLLRPRHCRLWDHWDHWDHGDGGMDMGTIWCAMSALWWCAKEHIGNYRKMVHSCPFLVVLWVFDGLCQTMLQNFWLLRLECDHPRSFSATWTRFPSRRRWEHRNITSIISFKMVATFASNNIIIIQ
jgi:hypothetical protein